MCMKKYDLTVVGGGTAGCAAAYIAGISGLNVLVIEKNIHLGGSITSGLVVPAMYTGKNLINTDFFDIFCKKLNEIGGQITYQNNPGWFNPELAKYVLDKLMAKADVDVFTGASVKSVTLKDNTIESLSVNNDLLSEYNSPLQTDKSLLSEPIYTRYVIDSTGNCEIGKMCGCEFIDKKDENQPISLRFIMSGIDLDRFSKWLLEYDSDRDVTTVEHINGSVHLSTAYTWDTNKHWALAPLFDDAVSEGILTDTDRNYFQIFTVPGMSGSVAFNCPRIPEITDIYNISDISKALKTARGSIFRLSNFCKKYLPGFEYSYISNIADMPGIRVSRRIRGKYIYTIDDLRSGKVFENPVLISSYPVDVHSVDKNSSTLEKTNEYSLPIESLMSNDIKNLFVAGRCISADFMSQGALRVQPNCFSMGEGAAKYIVKLLQQ